jgi:hypothetical protein
MNADTLVMPPEWDEEMKCWVVRRTEHFDVRVIPMIFNDRLVIADRGHTFGYDHGWCYDKGGAAVLAALVWDPETQDAPVGWKKQATPGSRVAPTREDAP